MTVSVPVSPTAVGAPSSVGVGSNPSGVAVSGSRVFVVNSSANTLTVYDTANNNALVRTVNVGASPSAVVVSSDGSTAWVANTGGSTVSRINTATWQVSTVNVGSAPRGLALSPDGATLWVANSGNNSVSRINTVTNVVSAPIAVGWAPQAIAVSPDGASVWVANTSSSTVQRINTATNAAGAHIYVGWAPMGITVTNDRVMTSNFYSNSVSVVNIANSQVSTVNVGPNPTAISLSADRSLAFVANSNDTVSIIDTRTNAVIRTATVDSAAESGAHGITVGTDGRLYVTDAFDNSLRILTIARVNSAPTTGTPIVQPPNASGVVTGTIPVNDADNDSLTITVTTPPAHGSTVSVTPAGAFTYTPTAAARNAAAQPGGPQTATFTVTVSDGLASTTRQVTVPVLPTPIGNRPPQASPTPGDPNSITGVVTGDLNASDPDGNPLTYTVIGQPHDGSTVSVTSTGGFTFTPSRAARDAAVVTPDADTDTFVVRISDGQAAINVAVPVTVLPTNRAPVPGTPEVTAPNASTGLVTGIVRATDPDGNPLTYSVTGAPGKGSVNVNATTGAFSYTPTAAARAAAAQTPGADTDSFTVTISDGQATATRLVTVTVAPTNTAPVAGTPTMGNPNAATGAVIGSLNVIDTDGNPLTYTITGQPASGTVALAGGGFTYTPTAAARLRAGQTPDFDTDSFTVAASDGVLSTTTTVRVPVSPTAVGAPSSVGVGSNPSGVAVSGSRVFVVNSSANTLTVYDTANNNALVRTVNVGASPSAVVVSSDGSTAWVANTGSNTVSKISTTSWAVTNINVGAAPRALAITTDGSVWVANANSNTVQRINSTTNAVGTPIGVGWAPSALAAAPDGSVWVANASSNTVQRINTVANTAGAHIYVGWVPTAIAVTNDRVLVSNQASNTVSVITIATSQVGTINVGPAPTAVALSPDRSLAYVANSNDTVTIIDVRATTVIVSAPVDLTAENGAHGITIGADGRLYVTDAFDSSLRILAVSKINSPPAISTVVVGAPNASSGAVTGQVVATDIDGNLLTYTISAQPVNGSNVTVNATGGFTYTPSAAARQAAGQPGGPTTDTFTVSVSDTPGATRTVAVTVPISPAAVQQIPFSRRSINVGGYPSDVVEVDNRLYVADANMGVVSVVDKTTGNVLATVQAGVYPGEIVFDSQRNRIYLSNYGYYSLAAGVTVINVDRTSPNYLEATFIDVPVDINPCAECWDQNGVSKVAVSADGNRVYALATDGYVSVIDTATNTVISRNALGRFDDAVLSSDGTRLYGWQYADFADMPRDQVDVIDTATMTKIGTVNVLPEHLGSEVEAAISRDGKRAYAVVRDRYTHDWGLSVIDLDPSSATYHREIAVINVQGDFGVWATDVAVNSDGSRAYVLNHDGQVVVIDTAANRVLGKFTVYDPGNYDSGASITVASDGTIYVTDYRGTVYAATVGTLAV